MGIASMLGLLYLSIYYLKKADFMINPISALPETTKKSIFFHRDKANQSVAASLGLIILACPCSKLLAEHTLLTPMNERFVKEKTTKESNYLDDLIHHNTYLISPHLFFLKPNSTHLIFAMNYENERGEKTDGHSGESEGAGAQQPQPLTHIPLPPMNHAQITAMIQILNSDLDEDSLPPLNTMLSYVPVTLTNENLTLANMIQQITQTLDILPNYNQDELINALYSIQSTQSPIDITKLQQQQSLAMLMVAYYTAINSSGAKRQDAHVFFNSFLLHAACLSGIERLYTKKDDLLGTKEPIEDREVLNENIKESASVFTALKSLEKMRLAFSQELEDSLEADESGASVNPLLIAAFSLLNHEVNINEMFICERNIRSYKRMLRLIREYDGKKPELIASNNQILCFIHAISLTLDPFVIQSANEYVDSLTSYLSTSNRSLTTTESADKESKEQKLFKIFKKVLSDAKDNPGNENPELFKDLLLFIAEYISQQSQNTFIDRNDYQAMMVTLGTGFEDLLEQSHKMLLFLEATIVTDANDQVNAAKYNEAAKAQKGKELSEEEKKIKHLKERIHYLDNFVDWFRLNYDFIMKTPYSSDSSDTDSSDTEILDTESSDADRVSLDGI
ncbi:hypothetical protein [Endozoicomonas sp. 8E]|uniref:hypothetical protein n=1 Tax=Endozoicomonas sp. 8E TaxID=3035692 RepID=UPI002938D8D0|nr:hypothetical protein [Endozoicomonas sp. 8E]WOG28209.1 hypothetical protein P6910_00750 [Endozoicomonas sp. 8E]